MRGLSPPPDPLQVQEEGRKRGVIFDTAVDIFDEGEFLRRADLLLLLPFVGVYLEYLECFYMLCL